MKEEEEEEAVKKHIVPVFPHFFWRFSKGEGHNKEEGTESRGLEDEEYEVRRHFTRHSRRRSCAKADFQTFHGQLK